MTTTVEIGPPIGPITCRCGLRMRPCAVRDAWECRCGVTVDGDLAESGQPIPDAAFQQGEPWKDPAAGLRVSDKFGDIGIGWESTEIDLARLPSPLEWQRLNADAFECSGQRYIGPVLRTDDFKRTPRAPNSGRVLILESGEELQRHAVYALVPLGQEAEGVAAVVRFIANKHGTGHVWAHGDVPIGPLKKRAQVGCRGAELSGVLHVVLGCYYFHKPIN